MVGKAIENIFENIFPRLPLGVTRDVGHGSPQIRPEWKGEAQHRTKIHAAIILCIVQYWVSLLP